MLNIHFSFQSFKTSWVSHQMTIFILALKITDLKQILLTYGSLLLYQKCYDIIWSACISEEPWYSKKNFHIGHFGSQRLLNRTGRRLWRVMCTKITLATCYEGTKPSAMSADVCGLQISCGVSSITSRCSGNEPWYSWLKAKHCSLFIFVSHWVQGTSLSYPMCRRNNKDPFSFTPQFPNFRKYCG